MFTPPGQRRDIKGFAIARSQEDLLRIGREEEGHTRTSAGKEANVNVTLMAPYFSGRGNLVRSGLLPLLSLSRLDIMTLFDIFCKFPGGISRP